MEGPIGYETMSSALPDAKNYHRWILDLIQPRLRGCGLEVGCGYGQYSPLLAAHLDHLVAVDCDSVCVSKLQQQMPQATGKVADLTCDSFTTTVGKASIDVAVCLNVLEHIPDDVAALRRMAGTLKPGGELLLLVPAHEALYGPMDRFAGHFRRYNRALLRERLTAAGLEPVQIRYFNSLGGLGWWVNAKWVRPKGLSDPMVNRQILWYDRYVQPVSRALDPLTRGFFGQSCWAVARQPR